MVENDMSQRCALHHERTTSLEVKVENMAKKLSTICKNQTGFSQSLQEKIQQDLKDRNAFLYKVIAVLISMEFLTRALDMVILP